MAVTPSGSPAWVRTASHVDYGGHVGKVNLHGQGLTDPRTDVGAEAITRLASDLAAVARTCPLVTITYLCNDSVIAHPTIESVLLMTGVRFVNYAGDAAPTGFPSGERNGNGDVTLTILSSLSDEYGVSGDVSIVGARATVQNAAARTASYEIPTANTLRVRAWNGASALSDARVTVSIWTKTP